VTIQIDDAGWGDPVGGVFIGLLRVETQEYFVREIEVTHFQPPNFSRKTYLERGLEIVLEGLRCLAVEKEEPIHVCRGVVLDRVREGLEERGYRVIPTKIEGQLQELVEATLVTSLARLGIEGLPRVSGKERFFRQLEWLQEDLASRECYAKTGWRKWSTKLRNWRPPWRRPHREKPPLLIIKFGGSVITDKTRPSTPRPEAISALVREIASLGPRPLIVVHGGGSYGHFPAERYNLKEGGRGRTKKLGVTETEYEMTELGQLILAEFLRAGLPAMPIRSSSIIVALNGRISHMDMESLRSFLELGFIPILSGDVTADSVRGFTIISGDQIVMYLARQLGAFKVIFASDVEGLYTADPKRDPSAKLIPLITPDTLDEVMEQVALGSTAAAADVTEGMKGKLTEILRDLPKDCEAIICDLRRPGTLKRLLAGEEIPCTRLRHSSKATKREE